MPGAVFEQALLFHQSGRLAEAANLYRQILAQNPAHADALHLLGVIEIQRGNPSAALELIDRAIRIDSSKAAYFCNRGVVLQDLKRFDEALASYDRALAIRSDNAEVLNNRGTVLRELERFGQALSSYDRALTLRPSYAEALNNRGNTLRDLKRFDEALASYERALAVRQNYTEACSNRVAVLTELGRYDDALRAFDQLIALDPDNAAAYRDRGVVLQRLKRHDEAVACLEKAIALKPDYAHAYNNLGNVLAEEGWADEAIARYERALALKPDFVEAHMNAGKLLKSRGRFEEAIGHYRRATEIMPHFAEPHIELGDALIEQGRIEDAQAAAERAACLAGDAPFPHFPLGVLFARCGRKDEARRHLLKSLEQDVDDTCGARLILGTLGERVPGRASTALLRGLYAGRAAHWREADAGYRGHELVSEAVESLRIGDAKADILDAGCGSGLVGKRLRGLARQLDGVDLSPEMLQQAAQSGAYDGLHEGDLVKFLSERAAAYDIIVSAATLIHFGDLEPVFLAAAKNLRPNGLFAFTLFPNDSDERAFAPAPLGGLAEGGCYVHRRDYVARVAREAGFSVALMHTGVHEHDNRGRPVHALVVALRRENGEQALQ